MSSIIIAVIRKFRITDQLFQQYLIQDAVRLELNHIHNRGLYLAYLIWYEVRAKLERERIEPQLAEEKSDGC